MSDAYPACPSDLAGVLTAPFIDPKYIVGIYPLGGVNPPGHTAPIDHIYVGTTYLGTIPMYAPADAWITAVEQTSINDGSGNYVPHPYALTFIVCQGLVLSITGYADIIPELKAVLDKQTPNCTYGPAKPGHTNAGEETCQWEMLNFPVRSGEQIGDNPTYIESGVVALEVEIRTANYNQPARSDVDWSYYQDDFYAHAICMIDLYSGDLKSEFDQKFGFFISAPNNPVWIPRTSEPVCGQVNQDIPGTIQGMWFGAKPTGNESPEFEGLGLAFLHDNNDPTEGEISIGGNIIDQAAVIYFKPTHSGLVNREPSEVTADGQVYCYNSDNSTKIPHPNRDPGGKVLVQLLDAHHLKVEHLSGRCTANETFINPFTYER